MGKKTRSDGKEPRPPKERKYDSGGENPAGITPGHRKRMREDLRDARGTRSTREIAELIVASGATESLTGETVRRWEHGEQHPNIDGFASWARVLGYQLIVDLVPSDDPYIQIPVRNDLLPITRLMGSRLAKEDVPLLMRLVAVLCELQPDPDPDSDAARYRRFLRDDTERGERDIRSKRAPKADTEKS